MVLLLGSIGDAFASGIGTLLVLLLLAGWIAAAIWFFRGPAKASETYVDTLASQLPEQDAALFRSMYLQKGGKSTVAAWLLTVFLSPTISYLYQGAWVKSAIAFFTLQGFGFWWIISWFSMPFETMAQNKRAADDALIQLRLMRPNLAVAMPNATITANATA